MERKELLNGFIHSANCYKKAIDILIVDDFEDLSTLYPCLFLIRQYLELILKALIIKCVKDKNITNDKYIGHKLKALMNEIADNDEIKDILLIVNKSKVIDLFDDIDQNGDYYRYPITTKNIMNKMETGFYLGNLVTENGDSIITEDGHSIAVSYHSTQQINDINLAKKAYELILLLSDRINMLKEV